ncbi:hypothetical protein GGR57DRAFT_201138 [Xylariaceae sp. FL1272]|nr:hypothetical protein GGR57DRAFT_201138 [Xylariaceae sp. FL1272]
MASQLAVGFELPPNEDRHNLLMTVWWTEFATGSLFMLLRLAARWSRRSLGLDDVFMSVAWLIYVGATVAVDEYAVKGSTRHLVYLTPDQLSHAYMLDIVIQALGVACTGIGKIAIGITLLRIIGPTSKWDRRVIWFVIVSTALTAIIDIALSLFQCGDPRALWNADIAAHAHCIDTIAVSAFNVFAATWQAFSDFVFSLLPVRIIWRLRMPLRRRLILILALGLTLFTGGAALAKTILFATADPLDITWELTGALIWFSTEVALIIVCGTVPVLYPIGEGFVKWAVRRNSVYRLSNSGRSASSSGSKISADRSSAI